MSSTTQQEVIVVGSGVGGLSAAILLGATGRKVLLLEAAAQWGGKAGTALVEGVEVDTGPSVLTLPEIFESIFRAAGTSLDQQLCLRKPEPAFRYRFADAGPLDVYLEPERTLQSVAQSLGTEASRELRRFLSRSAEIWDAAAPHFVWSEAPAWHGLLTGGWAQLRAVGRIDPLRTLQASIEQTVKTPELRMLLERYATYNGSDVRRAPGTLACIAHVELGLGGYGVQGGMHELVRSLVRTAQDLGVRMVAESPVTELLWESGRVAGVRCGQREHRAQAVVFNGEVAALAEGLLPKDAPSSGFKETERSMSAVNAIYRARRRQGAERRVAHEVLFPRDYLAEFSALFDEHRAPAEPTLYLCAQEACHGRTGWEQEEPVFVMANAPAVDPRVPDGDTERLSATMESRLYEHGLLSPGDRRVFLRTPADLARRFPSSRGALYGAASNGAMSAFRRPPNALSQLPGLYLASGSAHPGGGLPMVAASGRQAALAVLDDLGAPASTLRLLSHPQSPRSRHA